MIVIQNIKFIKCIIQYIVTHVNTLVFYIIVQIGYSS